MGEQLAAAAAVAAVGRQQLWILQQAAGSYDADGQPVFGGLAPCEAS